MIHLRHFVCAQDIDPAFYEKTCYVGSREDESTFRLLHEALRKTDRAGVGRFSFHDREYLVALRALDDVLALQTLRFHDEVVAGNELEIDGGSKKPSQKEVEMASRLVDTLAANFRPSDYEDTYRDAVLDVIKKKAKGKAIDLTAQEQPAHGDDLAAALEASLSGART